MFNISTEIVWMLNMLLLNDNKTPISNKIFTDEGDLTSDGVNIINEKCQGYVSYLRGENPVSFPVRLYPKHNEENIISSDNSPSSKNFSRSASSDSAISSINSSFNVGTVSA